MAALLISTRLYAAIINYVGNNHVGYWNACMDSLGQPGFTACSYVYWNNTKNYMQGVVDTYYISAPMICPGGRENYSPECVEFWVNYDNAVQALEIAQDYYAYWSNQMFG